MQENQSAAKKSGCHFFFRNHPLIWCKITKKYLKRQPWDRLAMFIWDTKVNFKDPFSNSENPKMEAKTTTKKTFNEVTDSNNLQTSSLWTFLRANRPNQATAKATGRQQSKQKERPFFGRCLSWNVAKMLSFFFKNTQKSRKKCFLLKIHKNQEKKCSLFLKMCFFMFFVEAALIF